MWTCANCRELIEDQFDACWSCGCSREGKLNLDFIRQPGSSTDDSSVEAVLASCFRRPRRQRQEATAERVEVSGVGLAKLLAEEFLAVSCENCGYTEFYNLSILEGRTKLQEFFRGRFGG